MTASHPWLSTVLYELPWASSRQHPDRQFLAGLERAIPWRAFHYLDDPGEDGGSEASDTAESHFGQINNSLYDDCVAIEAQALRQMPWPCSIARTGDADRQPGQNCIIWPRPLSTRYRGSQPVWKSPNSLPFALW